MAGSVRFGGLFCQAKAYFGSGTECCPTCYQIEDLKVTGKGWSPEPPYSTDFAPCSHELGTAFTPLSAGQPLRAHESVERHFAAIMVILEISAWLSAVLGA